MAFIELIKNIFLEGESRTLRMVTDRKIVSLSLKMKEPFHIAHYHLAYITYRRDIYSSFEKLVYSPFTT